MTTKIKLLPHIKPRTIEVYTLNQCAILVRGNQTLLGEMTGINRGTIRKMLAQRGDELLVTVEHDGVHIANMTLINKGVR